MSRNWRNGLESEPVTTYVDEDVKKAWREHADEMGVSLSRFIEMMVNAGRIQFSESSPIGGEDAAAMKREIEVLRDRLDTNSAVESNGDAIEVYRCLSKDYREISDISLDAGLEENQVYEGLQDLLSEDLVEYNPMQNAYRRTE